VTVGDIADWLLSSQDPFDDDDERENGSYAKRPPRCKHCGSTDVRWRQQTGKWVLFSLEPGKMHVCDLDASAFEVLK